MVSYGSSCCWKHHFNAVGRVSEGACAWKPNDLKLYDKLLVVLDSSLRVEVRAGSQIATTPLHRLLSILRLSSCWLQLPMRYTSGTGVVGSLLQWWKQPAKWSGSGEFSFPEEEGTCLEKWSGLGNIGFSSGMLHCLCWSRGEKHC